MAFVATVEQSRTRLKVDQTTRRGRKTKELNTQK
jgi:hypothetical protein